MCRCFEYGMYTRNPRISPRCAHVTDRWRVDRLGEDSPSNRFDTAFDTGIQRAGSGAAPAAAIAVALIT